MEKLIFALIGILIISAAIKALKSAFHNWQPASEQLSDLGYRLEQRRRMRAS